MATERQITQALLAQLKNIKESSGYKSVVAPEQVYLSYTPESHVWDSDLTKYPQLYVLQEGGRYTDRLAGEGSKERVVSLICKLQIQATPSPIVDAETLSNKVDDMIEDIERLFLVSPQMGGATFWKLIDTEDDRGSCPTQAIIIFTVSFTYDLRVR